MKRNNKRKPLISALEPRILFDGAALTTAVDILDNNSYDTNTSTQDSVAKNDATTDIQEAPATQGFERDRKEVAFIDTNVEDYQTLVNGIDSNTDVYLVESFNDISNILENLNDIDSIHILSHGSTGEITIGNDILNQNTLSSYEGVLNSIKTSLNESGDILLYGCNVASDGSGEEFINKLSTLTKADIAASNDITGNSALSGDWDLEYKKGDVEAEDLDLALYDGTLGTGRFVIESTITSNSDKTNDINYTSSSGGTFTSYQTTNSLGIVRNNVPTVMGNPVNAETLIVTVTGLEAGQNWKVYYETTGSVSGAPNTGDHTRFPSISGTGNTTQSVSFTGDGDFTEYYIVLDAPPVVNSAPVITDQTSVIVSNDIDTSTIVVDYNASDANSTDTLTWSLTGTDASLFNINSSGQVTFKAVPTKASYDFNVEVNDGNGGTDSDAFTVNVNQKPIVSDINSLSYTEGDDALVIDSDLTLVDVDDTNLESATVSITNNFVSSEDVLAFTDQNGITGTWDSSTGVLTLSGNASKAQYEMALESITYENTNTTNAIDITDRIISWTVNDGIDSSLAIISTINLSKSINEAPIFSSSNTFTIAENTTAVGTVIASDTEIDTAVDFAGSDDYASNTAFDLSSVDLTLEGWFSFNDLTNQQNIIRFMDTSNNDYRIVPFKTSSNEISYYINDGSTSNQFNTGFTVKAEEFYHMAFVYDGTNSTASVYINGELTNVNNISTLTLDFANQGDTTLVLASGETGSSFNSDVKINDFRVWNEARTLQEIKDNMNIELQGDETNLTAYYKMDETSGTNLADSTSNSYNLTIGGNGTNLNTTQSGDIITYSIIGGSDASLFVIDSNTGELAFKASGMADYETKTSYDVIIKALDKTSQLSSTQNITVNLTDDGLTDSDSDGVEDVYDIDDDNDGILDIYETQADFKWATYSSFNANIAEGTIGGIDFTYNLQNTDGTNLNIQTTNAMFNHTIFPTEYNVPNSTTIKNTVQSLNTLTFDETMLNPLLVFSSVGNGSIKVPIQFYDDIEVVWANSTYGTGTIDGDGDGDLDYTYDSTSKTLTMGQEGYVIVKLKGQFDSVKFKYTANENYVNFTFGGDIRADVDTDADGTVDRLDTDSDGDGVLDNVEAQVAGGSGISDPTTLNGYVAQSGTDIDYDGLDDAYDSDTANAQATASAGIDAIDSNANGTLDYLVDEPPVLTVGTLTPYNSTDGNAVVIAPNLSLVDVENQNIDQAKVQINNFETGDTLSFSTQNGIAGSFNSTSGILTLSGTASVSDYEAALKSVVYDNSDHSNMDLTDRTFSFTVGSAIAFSGNGHFYEFISANNITWSAAKAAAEAKTLYGMQGYLATITSAEENSFVTDKLAGNGWIGASDEGQEGVWKWVTGPESGTQFSDASGNSVNSQYENWSAGEPNEYTYGGNVPQGEEYAHFWGTGANKGEWNDFPNAVQAGFTIDGYIVEYGGMSGETTPIISGTSTMDIIENQAPILTVASNPSAIDFDGTNDYLTTSESLLNGLTEFTISMWVNPDVIKSSGNMSLVGQNDAFEIFMYKSGSNLMLKLWNRSELANSTTEDIEVDFNVTSYFTTGTWSHIALTGSDVSSGALGDIKMYVNGSEVADEQTSNSIVNWGSSSDFTTIGGRVQNGSAGNDYFDAKFDEVSIWTRALTATEINDLQTARLDGNENNLIAYWTMDEGSGLVTENKVLNSSINSNMTLTNGPTWITSTLNVVTTYNENDNPAIISPSVTLSDVDDTTLASASVSISTGFVDGDTISFTNDGSTMGNITASYNSTTGVMTLVSSGNTALISEWENALASVTYHTTNDIVNNGSRTVSWSVNDGDTDSVIDTSTINITGYGAKPLIYGTDAYTIVENGSVNFDGFTVSDSDTSPLTVSITATNGTLSLGTTTGISGYSSATKTLEITGTPTDLTTALNDITYTPDSGFNGEENLVIKASDDKGSTWSDYFISRTGLFYNSDNGHYYEYVADAGKTWDQAKTLAENRTYLGLGGYLATVTSASENALIASKLGANGWFGASDAESEGIWKWATGPEAGTQFWQDSTTAGSSSESNAGSAVNGMYNNWVSGEPNNSDSGRGGEDVAHYYATGGNAGFWNDFNSNNTGGIGGYIVEYGGLSTDASATAQAATLKITVTPVNDAPILSVTGVESSPSVEYVENADPITLLTDSTITDVDNTTLKSATVSISTNFTAGDTLSFTNDGTTMGNIQSSYDASTGELTLISPSIDDAFEFDGNDDYIISDVPYTQNFTLEAWIKPDVITGGYREILSWNEDGSNENVQLRINPNGKLEFGMTATGFDATNYTNYLISDEIISTGIWTHVSVSYNSDDTSAKLFVNGKNIASKVITEVGINNITPERFMIGAYTDPYETNAFDFDGQIKEIRVWNDVRSLAEIKTNMNQSLDLTDLSNDSLVGYWTPSNTSNNTISDLSGNSNDATLEGGAKISSNGKGTATIQEWKAALESIQFSSTNVTPGTSKTISWTVDDGETLNHASDTETTSIDIKEVYTEQETNYNAIDSTVDLSTFTGDFSGQYVEFDVDSRTSTESLGFSTETTASTTNGAISIVGTAVYLGDGTNASVIGKIDGIYNGQNGNKLRINFDVGFTNADFEIGSNGDKTVKGWTFGKEKVVLGTTSIGGFTTPDTYAYPSQNSSRNLGDNYTASRAPVQNTQMSSSYQSDDNTSTTTSNETDNDGDLAILLDTGATSIGSGYGIIRGPYVISDSSVTLVAGDKIAFDWKALAGGDAYAAYGYLLNTANGNTIEILDDTGASYRSETAWTTTELNIANGQEGEYKFVFIAGSFDRTGGRWVGGKLMIDNVIVTQSTAPSINNTVLKNIAQSLTYTDSSDLTYENNLENRTINILGENSSNTTFNTTHTFEKQEVNDQIVLNSVSDINYVDTDAKDTFNSQSGTLSSSDVDSGTTAVYEIIDGTTNGTTITKVGDYGTLTLDSSTGAYTYTPNNSVMDALSSSSSEDFTFIVSDNNPNGLSTTDTKTLTINVSAVNDLPLLGGNSSSVTFTENGSAKIIDPTITISDSEGTSYDGGYLNIKNTLNGQSSDILNITEIGGITISGADISYAGTLIGTVDTTYNGTNGKDLKINLNSDAYSVQVQALAQAIAYSNASDDLSSNARTYQFQVNDGGNSGSTARYSSKDATVNINSINDLPVISLDSSSYEVEKVVSTNPNGTLNLSGISLSDADHSTLTVIFETTSYGNLTFDTSVSGGISSSDISNNGTQIVSVTSTIAKINATLANSSGLIYVAGNGNDIVTPGATSLKITASDALSGQDISTKEITILPAVPNAYSDNIVENEGNEVSVNLENLIDDINGTIRTITFGTGTADTDSDGSGVIDGSEVAGSLAAFDTSKEIKNDDNKLIGYQLENGTLTIAEGTLDDATPIFNFVYTPYTGTNWSGTDKFVYQYSSDGKTSLIAQINIVVKAVNDAPSITLANGTAETIDEDNTLVFNSINSNAITLADVDNTGSETFDLTLSVSKGKLDLSQVTGLSILEGADGSGKIKLNGTLANLKSAIDGLTYTPNSDYNGSDNLVIDFNDKGNIGSGNVLNDTKTIVITINAVNDAPVIDASLDINITDGTGASIIDDTYVNYLQVSDPDSSSLTYKIDNDGIEDSDYTDLVNSKVGTYGTLTIDPTTGKYTFSPDKAAIALLTSDVTESFVLDVFDGTTHTQTTIDINLTASAQSSATYTEQDPATLILTDTTIQTDESYGGGYLDFEVSSPEASEILSLERLTSADITDGEISIVGNSIYLGDGSSAKIIAQIDGTYDGKDGEKLRVNFTVSFENGNFEIGSNNDTSIPGWSFGKEKVVLGSTSIAGFTTPTTYTEPSPLPASKDNWSASRAPTQTAKVSDVYQNDDDTSNTTSSDTDGSDLAVYLDTGGTSIRDGYGIIRGPYVYSDSTVDLVIGDSVAFDWKALAGGDAYAAYGYLLNVDTGDTIELLDDTGTSSSSETAWATAKTTVNANGEYRFVFIAGSWDRSGGRYVGGKLMIDNVSVTQANPASDIGSDVLEKIAKKVTYENSGDLTANNSIQNKTVTITTVSGDNTTHSDTKALDIQEVNDSISLLTPATINYQDTSIADDFQDTNATLSSNDADSNTSAIYGIDGGTISGTTITKVGSYGTLTLDSNTGEYTYTPNDSVINALETSTSESFTFTVSDNNPTGIASTDTKTLLINISAVNDGPVLGGVDSTITYTENGAAKQIDPTVTVNDPENNSYAQGFIKANINSNVNSGDILTINSIGGITLDGTTVKYGTANIGTIDGTYDGTNGKDLLINLTSNAYSLEVQSLLRAISYKSTNDAFTNLSRTVEFTVNDGGNAGTTTPAFSTKEATVNILEINDLPVIDSGTSIFEVEKVIGSNENGNLYLTGISISDLDETGDVTVVLETTNTTSTYGLLTIKTDVPGGVGLLDVSENGTKSVTITGSIDEINATLADANGIKYVAGSGSDSVTPGANSLKITVTDSLNGSESASKEVITLPAVPNGYSDNVTLDEDSSVTYDIDSLTIDINDNSGSYKFGTIGVPGTTSETNGVISIDTLGSITEFTSSEIISADLDLNNDGDTLDDGEQNLQIGYQLDNGTLILANDKTLGNGNANFIFTPNENFNGSQTIYYQYISGDGTVSPVSSILFYVRAVNDAPVITSNSSESVDEDTSLAFSSSNGNRIILSDVDVTSETLEVIMDVSKGKLTLNDITGLTILEGANNDAHIKIRGNISDLQNAMDNMTYLGNKNYFGNDTLEMTINDLGNVGVLGNKLSFTKSIDMTINAVNDAPTQVADDNLNDDKLAFGDEYSQDISYMFSDVEDSRYDMDFIATGLPKGLTLDPRTGLISGKISASGKFNVTVRAYDTGMPILSSPVKTFLLEVTAPPQMSKPSTDIQESKKDDSLGDENTDSLLNQALQSEETGTDSGLDITRTELTLITKDGNNNDNGNVVQASLGVNVLTDGKVNFGDESSKAFETVGLTIEKLEFKQDQLEIKVVDTRVGQKYRVTLSDGTALPSTLNFDPNTGIIKGTLPAGMEELEISIKALSSDGTTRILNLKIDINDLKEKEVQNNEAKYETLKEQIQAQNHKMSGYGDYISSLFDNSSIA